VTARQNLGTDQVEGDRVTFEQLFLPPALAGFSAIPLSSAMQALNHLNFRA
jgi:hypothetical protein